MKKNIKSILLQSLVIATMFATTTTLPIQWQSLAKKGLYTGTTAIHHGIAHIIPTIVGAYFTIGHFSQSKQSPIENYITNKQAFSGLQPSKIAAAAFCAPIATEALCKLFTSKKDIEAPQTNKYRVLNSLSRIPTGFGKLILSGAIAGTFLVLQPEFSPPRDLNKRSKQEI